MKILIVEDDNTVITVLKLVLRSHELTICTGIEEGPIDAKALACLNQDLDPAIIDLSEFDLAFLDGNLVGSVLGIVLVEPLKQFGAVTVSTSANLELVSRFKQLGVDYVREKSDLVAFVKERLNEATALRQARLAER